jgi:hypothetical protein
MSKLDRNGKPVAEGYYNNQTIPILCDEEGRLIIEAGTKNSSYTTTEERAVLNKNGTPSLIAVNPSGAIRKIRTTSDGKIKFVQK